MSLHDCKTCGAKHGMGIEDMSTGNITPIDICRDCLFPQPNTIPTPNPIEFVAEWGGTMRCIVDGKSVNIADHLNELERNILKSMRENE